MADTRDIAAAGSADDVPVVVTGAADQEAEFAAFMVVATPALSRTAWLLCGDAHRAEELVQQALVKTYLAWPRASQGDPLVYARRVLSNARIDAWRKHRREHLVPPEDLPERSVPSGTDSHASHDALIRALRRLTPANGAWSY